MQQEEEELKNCQKRRKQILEQFAVVAQIEERWEEESAHNSVLGAVVVALKWTLMKIDRTDIAEAVRSAWREEAVVVVLVGIVAAFGFVVAVAQSQNRSRLLQRDLEVAALTILIDTEGAAVLAEAVVTAFAWRKRQKVKGRKEWVELVVVVAAVVESEEKHALKSAHLTKEERDEEEVATRALMMVQEGSSMLQQRLHCCCCC